jgi:hypothetical protein
MIKYWHVVAYFDDHSSSWFETIGYFDSLDKANLGKEVIGYDIFDVLVNFWNVLLNNPEELSNKMNSIPPTNEEYTRIKELLITLDKTQDIPSLPVSPETDGDRPMNPNLSKDSNRVERFFTQNFYI